MSLAEIRKLRDQRSPGNVDEILAQHIGGIDEKISDLLHTRKLLATIQKSVHLVANIDEQAIAVQFLPAEAIILGEPNDFHRSTSTHSHRPSQVRCEDGEWNRNGVADV